MEIWSFSQNLTRRLRSWAIISVLSGLILQFSSRFGKGIGVQFAGWGIINYLIAWFGDRSTQERLERLDDPQDPDIQHQEAVKLRRLLLVNGFLDVLYILGGARLAKSRAQDDPFGRGNGIGIILQGGFLLIFDLYQAFMLNRRMKDRTDQVNG